MNEAVDNEAICKTILESIDRSERGKWSIKIKTLMAGFGLVAIQRVRQSSFLAVLDSLNQWGIEYRYNGNAANDYITLSRGIVAEPDKPITLPLSTPTDKLFERFSLLAHLFHVGDTLDEVHSQTISIDVQNAVWSFQPVCLLVEAGEEFFSFICGLFSVIMRRRAMMIRNGNIEESVPCTPDIIAVDQLKGYFGQPVDFNSQGRFPKSGAVYILRDNPDDVEDDEIIAQVRECFIPHTYRFRAKFETTSGDISRGKRAKDDPGFNQVVVWMYALAGTLQLSQTHIEQQVDIASLLAEAVQKRDTLFDRQALRPTDTAFRAGFESTEHMVLKSTLLNYFLQHYPRELISVEESINRQKNESYEDQDRIDHSRRDKPDLLVGKKIWVEVETMRSLSLQGSNPFFTLESKLRHKLNNMRSYQEIWLIVPNDIALLASEQICALARNLNIALESSKLRCGFMDINAEAPVFLNHEASIPAINVRLSGISWRTQKPHPPQSLTWDDIAGYSDLKERLREDFLDPLLDPEKYYKYGLFAANGLLLYGLPGCGKSLIGRVLAGENDLVCKVLMPSDITSMWLGEGTMKIRALFDWALKQPRCLLVLDELDGVAPQRSDENMHTNEKRQVNELLSQLDRINGKGVVVVATTNYMRGIDTAIQRSGRFDVKLPVFPPDASDRAEIFKYYLSPPRLKEFKNTHSIDMKRLAEESLLFTAADIKTVVQTAARKAIHGVSSCEPSLSTESISNVIRQHPRSIRSEMARDWVRETTEELGGQDKKILWLKEEIERAFGKDE